MPDDVFNPFVSPATARRYAAARPDFHPVVAEKIAEFTKTPAFRHALDVGCGTGQSARAMVAIADSIDAIDVSAAMIAAADPHTRVHFAVAPAEKLPFRSGLFDLVTVGLAFHWFDQPAFLAEAARVMKPLGWLVIYNHGFAGEMEESPAFKAWAWETYPKQFPQPPREARGVADALVPPGPFALRGTEAFTTDHVMTVDELAAYLTTQSNVVAAIETGVTTIDAATEWIADGVRRLFKGERGTMKFAGTIDYVQKTA